MINQKIGNFLTKSHLGSGGMADVYFAENSIGKKVAIKILKKELCANTQFRDRFIQEATIIAGIDHPNIRQVFDIDEIGEQPAIILEYLEGETLKNKIEKHGKVTTGNLRNIYDQCLDAIQYTHSKKIIHRDIKPSNIFITNNDRVKILDYGIAKFTEGNSQTLTGQMLGTVMYMSPEQITDPKRVTAATDLYSLGVTMYHALKGSAPYNSTESQFKLQLEIINEGLDLSIIQDHYWRKELSILTGKSIDSKIYNITPLVLEEIDEQTIVSKSDYSMQLSTITHSNLNRKESDEIEFVLTVSTFDDFYAKYSTNNTINDTDITLKFIESNISLKQLFSYPELNISLDHISKGNVFVKKNDKVLQHTIISNENLSLDGLKIAQFITLEMIIRSQIY